MGRQKDIQIKRAYELPSEEDGCRVLVDRLWPRGFTKASLKLDLWLKAVAPSTALRQWFGHEVTKWPEFQRRYRKELDAGPDGLDLLRERLAEGRVTLVFGAKDESHNQAVVLRDFLLTTDA